MSVSASTNKKAELVFQAQCQLTSETCCDDPQVLREFLERPAIRNLFLSAGGKRPCQSLSIHEHSSIVDLWHHACEKYYGMDALPMALSRMNTHKGHKTVHDSKKEEIAVLATETEVHFPGFKTINTVLNGCHLVPKGGDDATLNSLVLGRQNRLGNDHETACEKKDVVHKFYLVGDKKRWVGPAPVVWLVKKLTGEDGSNNAVAYKPSETRAVSQVSVYVRDGEDDGAGTPKQRPHVGFRLDIDCAVKVEFPQFLLRILPAPQSKVEERGTLAIRKAILQDAASAMQAVEEAWAKEQDRKRTSNDKKSWVYSLSR